MYKELVRRALLKKKKVMEQHTGCLTLCCHGVSELCQPTLDMYRMFCMLRGKEP